MVNEVKNENNNEKNDKNLESKSLWIDDTLNNFNKLKKELNAKEGIAQDRGELKSLKIELDLKKTNLEKQSKLNDLLVKTPSISSAEFLKNYSKSERFFAIAGIDSNETVAEKFDFTIDFNGNSGLERAIGLGDLMPNNVRAVESNGVIYKRRANQGFYNGKRYLPVFSGTDVKVVETAKDGDPNFIPIKKKFTHGDVEFSFKDVLMKDEDVESSEKMSELDQNIEKLANEYSIDPFLIRSINFILRPDEKNTDYAVLNSLSRFIQNAEVRFNGDILNAGVYTAEFIQFTMNRLNLFGKFERYDYASIGNVIGKYSKHRNVALNLPKRDEIIYDISNENNVLRSYATVVYPEDNLETLNINEPVVFDIDHQGHSFGLRKTAMKVFKRAEKLAEQYGFHLNVNSSYRSVSDQERILKNWWGSHPGATDAERRKWVAKPGTSPHHTGGAIDITPVYNNGSRPSMDKFFAVMSEAGFVNYHAERWHWEFGTKRYNKLTGRTGATYKNVIE